jgi:hypothetical protein
VVFAFHNGKLLSLSTRSNDEIDFFRGISQLGNMDAQIAKRLAMALAAKGINMKQAGLAAGLSPNYVRDVVRRGRGKFELLERVAEANGLSWLWLKTGEGEMEAPGATPKPRKGVKHFASPPFYPDQVELAEEKRRSPEPATEDLPVNILVPRATLLHFLQLLGASDERAETMVELLSWMATRKTKLP